MALSALYSNGSVHATRSWPEAGMSGHRRRALLSNATRLVTIFLTLHACARPAGSGQETTERDIGALERSSRLDSTNVFVQVSGSVAASEPSVLVMRARLHNTGGDSADVVVPGHCPLTASLYTRARPRERVWTSESISRRCRLSLRHLHLAPGTAQTVADSVTLGPSGGDGIKSGRYALTVRLRLTKPDRLSREYAASELVVVP